MLTIILLFSIKNNIYSIEYKGDRSVLVPLFSKDEKLMNKIGFYVQAIPEECKHLNEADQEEFELLNACVFMCLLKLSF